MYAFFQDRHIRGLLGPLLAFFCVAYFIYHSIQGERGLLSMLRTKQKLDIVRQEFNLLQSQKEVLERRVYLLRPDSLDLDMLEERARAVLNFARPDEVIIFEEKPKNFEDRAPSAHSPYAMRTQKNDASVPPKNHQKSLNDKKKSGTSNVPSKTGIRASHPPAKHV